MSTAFNPDDFIAGIRRSTAKVTIFQRPDLAGELNAIDAKLTALGEPDTEEDMTAGAARSELIEQYNRVQAELAESAQELTLQDIPQETVDELAEEARTACKERADKASKTAAGSAREECRRAEITDPKEIKEAVKRASSNASGAIIQHEVGIHILARAIVSDTGQPIMTVDQTRQVMAGIGEGQRQKVMKAFYEMSSTDPGSFVPKSLKPGPSDEA